MLQNLLALQETYYKENNSENYGYAHYLLHANTVSSLAFTGAMIFQLPWSDIFGRIYNFLVRKTIILTVCWKSANIVFAQKLE